MTLQSPILDAVATNPLPTLALSLGPGRVEGWNAAAADLFGCAEAPGGHLHDLLRSPAAELAVFLEAVCHYGRYVDALLTFQRADGTALRLQTFGAFDGTVRRDRVILSFLDLDAEDRRRSRTEETLHHRAGLMHWEEIHGFFRELEATNRLILDAAGEGIYGINAEGKATFINRAAQEMLGWNAEDLIGRELHSIIHHSHLDGSHFPGHTCPIYDSFRRDKTIRVDDDAFWRKDGRPIRVEYVSTPIYDRGVLAGAVIIFRDVTERRENERKLREALAELEALRRELEQENAYLITEIRGRRSGLIGPSASTRNLAAQIDLLADTATNVLVSGPPGAGKSLVTSAIHEASGRSRRPLVRLSCSDLTAEQLARDFFGYRKGAFPGAMRDTVGKIQLAANGTLHLDEVSDLPRAFQLQLLEVIRNGAYRRIGDDHDTPVDLRIVSTTARNLSAEVEAGRFRQDLFFELAVFPMRCEPLSTRPDDIPHLARHFLDASIKRLRLPQATLTKANVEALQRHGWPGNVRELENLIERAAILAQGGKLRFEFESRSNGTTDEVLTDREIKKLERENLVRCLRRAKGKVAGARGAAELLGLAPTTVYSRIRALDVQAEDW